MSQRNNKKNTSKPQRKTNILSKNYFKIDYPGHFIGDSNFQKMALFLLYLTTCRPKKGNFYKSTIITKSKTIIDNIAKKEIIAQTRLLLYD